MKKSDLRIFFLMSTAVLLYFFANLQRVAIPGTIFNELQGDLQTPAKYITALGSTFMYVYAAGQLVTGLLADRYGGERVIRFGAMLFSLGALLFPFCSSLWLLYFCRVLVGIGASSIYLSLVKMLADRFPDRFPVYLGITMLLGYAGGIAAGAPLVYFVHELSWRSALTVAGAVTVAGYILFVLSSFGTPLPPVRKDVPVSLRRFGGVLKKKHNRWLFCYNLCSFGSYYCLHTVIGKKFLEDFCTLSSGASAWVITVVGVIAASSAFIMSFVTQAFGNRRKIFLVLCGSTAVSCYGIIFLAACFNFRTPWLAVFFFFITWCANQNTITTPLMKETNPKESMGAVVSFSNFLAYVAVAVLGNLTGVLLDCFEPVRQGNLLIYSNCSYMAVFGMFLLLSGTSLVAACHLKESFGRDISASVR